MKIIGWKIQTWSNEFSRLGYVKKNVVVEFGNSPIRDKAARLEYIAELVRLGEDFSVLVIQGGDL